MFVKPALVFFLCAVVACLPMRAGAQNCEPPLSIMFEPSDAVEIRRFVRNERPPYYGNAVDNALLDAACAARVSTDMFSIKADWLIARQVTAHEYFSATLPEIKTRLREALASVRYTDDAGNLVTPHRGPDGSYVLAPDVRVVMLDIEPQLTDDPRHPGALMPNRWGDWLCPGRDFYTPDDQLTLGTNPPITVSFDEMLAAYALRVRAAREVIDESDPTVRIALFAVPVPVRDGAHAIADDGVVRDAETRLAGLIAARRAGVFNHADLLSPTIYPHDQNCIDDIGASGPCTDYYDYDADGDTRDTIPCIVRATNQGVDIAYSALDGGTYTNLYGRTVGIMPILSLSTRPGACARGRSGTVPLERLRQQVDTLRAKGIKEYAYWHGDSELDRSDTANCACDGLTHFATMGEYFVALFEPWDLNGDGVPCRRPDRDIAILRTLDLDCDGSLTVADVLAYIDACSGSR